MALSNEVLVREYQSAIAKNNERKSTKALSTLYEVNHGLLLSIAKRFSAYAEIDDLLQEGFIGLQKAAELYDLDYENEVKFSTYATTWIKQAMRKCVAESGLIRVPAHISQRLYNLNKIQTDYETKFGKSPSDSEICSLLEITPDQLESLRKTRNILFVRSFEEQISNDSESITLADTIPDGSDDIQEVLDSMYLETLSSMIWSEVDELGDIEANVYRLRYQDQYSFREIAEKMELSENQVKVIHDRAMRTLRKSPLIGSYRDDFICHHNFIGYGLKGFLKRQESTTELMALKLYDSSIRQGLKLI